MRKAKTILGLALVLIVLIVLSADRPGLLFRDWFGTRPERLSPAPSRPVRAGGYLGSQACRECHNEIYKAYQAHPMAQSMAPVGSAVEVESYQGKTAFQRPDSRRYQVERTVDGVFHHELGLSIDGETIYDQKVPVHFAVGSGRRGRSYLTYQDGTLLVSAISWYSKEKRWDLSPGYQPARHQRFERVATTRCLVCHAGRLAYQGAPTTDLVPQYQAQPFIEFGIGCERCHGPGALHVERHQRGSTVAEDPIVNPTKLTPFRRDAVCNQCHLQGAGHQLRVGRHYHHFRPGDQLGESWTLFVMGTGVAGDGSTTAVSHVEQMLSSVCYRASQGELGCVSCHDPHTVPGKQQRRAHFNGRCVTCHQQENCELSVAQRQQPPARGSCIDCHMPQLAAGDVPHTVQTDHRILRLPVVPDDSVMLTKGEEVAEPRIFDERENPLPEWEVQRAKGLMLAELVQSGGDEGLIREAEQLLSSARAGRSDDVQILDALAFVRLNQGKMEAAVATWKRALQIESDRQGPLDALAAYFQSRGDDTQAAQYLRRLIKILPWRADLHFRHGQMLERQGRPQEALEAAQLSYQRDPSRPEVYRLLLRLHADLGNREEAQTMRRRLRQLEWR